MNRQYLAEAMGTFALVFAGTGAIVANDASGGTVTHVGIALTFGLIVMAMIAAIGDVSGAHINPAVTFGLWVANRFNGKQVVPYIVAQLIGAIAASGLLRILFNGHETLGATLPAGSWWQSFVLEILLSCILMFVILNVTVGSQKDSPLVAISIGGVVALEALFAGPICGASMNPARSIAPALVSGNLQFLWIYIAAPILGMLLAVACFQCLQETSGPSSNDAK